MGSGGRLESVRWSKRIGFEMGFLGQIDGGDVGRRGSDQGAIGGGKSGVGGDACR